MKNIVVFLALFVVACSTPHRVKDLDDTEFQIKGESRNGSIGLNGKDQVVIKNERSVTLELQVQDLVNGRLRDKAESALYALKTCRRSLVDPTLGGTGRVSPLPDVDELRPIVEIREEMGLDKDGSLKIVSEEFLDARLTAERQYERELRKILAVAEQHGEDCASELRRVTYERAH